MGMTCYYLARMIAGDPSNGPFQQRMMRGRVGSQAFTIVVMCASGMWAGHRANKEHGCQNIISYGYRVTDHCGLTRLDVDDLSFT